MKALKPVQGLLLAACAALVVNWTSVSALHSMSPNWFRRKFSGVQNKLKWIKPRTPVASSDLAEVKTLADLVRRLDFAGFKGPWTEADFFSIFNNLKDCFKSFSPPPGLALDFSVDASWSPDDTIKNFFKFIPPSEFIHPPVSEDPNNTSFAEITADEAPRLVAERDPPEEQQAEQFKPLRTMLYARSEKHILAHIMRSVYSHFRGPACLRMAKRLDGMVRLLLRNNSKARALEPILVFSLLQGNVASAAKFRGEASSSLPEEPHSDGLQHADSSQMLTDASPRAGIYDPFLLINYFDLAKSADTPQMKKLNRLLQKPADARKVGNKLFGNSLGDPAMHERIAGIAEAVGDNADILRRVVEQIGQISINSAEAVSTLIPQLPNIADLVRGASFFAFESVFKQHGAYVMPGLPCGGNVTGSMLETLTGKKLGSNYFVYKYTEPVLHNSFLPPSVWRPHPESQVARYFREEQQANGEYMLRHVPRVCVRPKLFTRCSKKPPSDTKTNEQLLCHFINGHQSYFFEVNGEIELQLNRVRPQVCPNCEVTKLCVNEDSFHCSAGNGVYAMRRNMERSRALRERNALRRGIQTVRRFLLSKTSVALVLGAGVGALCAGAGLAGILSGSLCAVGAIAAVSNLRLLFAVAPFAAKPALPLSLGAFLASEFERNVGIVKNMLGVIASGSTQVTTTEESTTAL